MSLLFLVVCIAVIIYITTSKADIEEDPDVAPHTWNITREMWLGQPFNNSEIEKRYEPLRLVIINHSVSSECHGFRICAAELRRLQKYFIERLYYDIPYNFIVGNDGRIYEGRGWDIVGAHTLKYNKCSMGIGFLGDYRADSNTHSRPTEAQVERMNMLLAAGVERGYLHQDYVIVGHRDIRVSDSPGSNLYDIMQRWDRYDKERYRGKTCDAIMSEI